MRNLFKIVLLLLLPLTSLSQALDVNLTNTATVIRDEVNPKANTAVRVGQELIDIISGKMSRVEANSTSGTNTYTATIPWFTSYRFGLHFPIVFVNGNTGSATLNLNTLGAKNLVKGVTNSLVSGDIIAGQAYEVFYDGSHFQIMDISNVNAAVGGDLSGSLPNPSVVKLLGNSIPSNASGVLTNNGSGVLSWSSAGASYTADESTLHLATTVFSIKSTYPGQSSINTLGTITTGVWNGTSIADANISSSSNWNTAYNRSGTSLIFTSSTFTFTKQDATTLTVSVPTFNQNTTGSAGSVANALTVDNSSLQLNSGTTFDGSGARTISVKALGITNAMLAGSIASSKLVGTDIATVGTITTGTWNGTKIGLLYGGTNADLSASGGASQVLKQSSTGAAITVGQLAFTDISGTVPDGQLSTSYLKTDGSRALSGNWNTGNFNVTNIANLGIGGVTSPSAPFHLASTSTSTPRGALFDQYSNGTNSSQLTGRKSRSTSLGSFTTVQNSDNLVNFSAEGDDGTQFTRAASILMMVAAAPSTGIVPGKIILQTANGSGTLTAGLTLDQNQKITLAGALTVSTLNSTGLVHTNTSGDFSTSLVVQADVTSGYWQLTGTSTLSGVATITSNTNSQHIFNGTWTASGNNQNHIELTGSITARSTASDALRYLVVDPTLVSNAATQTLTGFFLNPTFTDINSATKYIARFQNGGSDRYTFGYDGSLIITAGNSSTNPQLKIIGIAGSTNKGFRYLQSDNVSEAFSVQDNGIVTAARYVVTGSGNGVNATNNATAIGYYGGRDVSKAHTFSTINQYDGASTTRTAVSIEPVFAWSTGTNNGTFLGFNGTLNLSGGTNVIRAIDYNPTETSLTGTSHYFITNRSATALSGFNTATPASTLDNAGSTGLGAYVAKTSNYSATPTDCFIDCTSNSFTVTLPTAVGITRRIYIIKNSGTATTITIATTSSQTIDGAAPGVLTTAVPLRLMSDGAGWKTF